MIDPKCRSSSGLPGTLNFARCAILCLSLFLGIGGASAAQGYYPTKSPAAETTPEGIGLQAASVLTSMVYLPLKTVWALAGGLGGGLAYAVTGGDMEVAKTVWEPSLYGTYVITPEHLVGIKPVQFIGSAPNYPRLR